MTTYGATILQAEESMTDTSTIQILTLSTYMAGGYSNCTVRKARTGRLIYLHHDSGSRERWRRTIALINHGDPYPNYVTSAHDYFPVNMRRS